MFVYYEIMFENIVISKNNKWNHILSHISVDFSCNTDSVTESRILHPQKVNISLWLKKA
jgi:hypothetical protein